jgi:hypothetical protein
MMDRDHLRTEEHRLRFGMHKSRVNRQQLLVGTI